jgi:nicotinamidase-related amidase
MSWKTAHRSFYYEPLSEAPELTLEHGLTALLVIDLQRCYLPGQPPAGNDTAALREWRRWAPFRERLKRTVLPNVQKLLAWFRAQGRDVLFARIACLRADGRDRSLSQARPGFNNLLMPLDEPQAAILPEIAPLPGEIVLTKTTDSALTGTNLRLLLHNLGIRHVVCCGIFTDQCVSSTVRSLADESFDVLVVDDACAAGTDELHRHELAVLNNLYCQVLETDELLLELGRLLGPGPLPTSS